LCITLRPTDVPGQAVGQADYVLIAEIVEVERWEQQASEPVQRLEDDLAYRLKPGDADRAPRPLKSSIDNEEPVMGEQSLVGRPVRRTEPGPGAVSSLRPVCGL
jgi:hypothetical protein